MAGRKPAAAEEHPATRKRRAAARRLAVFWRRLLTHRNVLALCLMYLPNSFIFYFCITWFPTYLSEGRGMEGRALAFFTGLPLMLSVAADLLGGPTTDWAVRRFGPRWGRAGVGFASYVVAGGSVLLAALTKDAWLAATLFALGTAANMFLLGSAWGTCQDIGGGHAGVVSATMNTAGQVGAMTCPLLVIYLKNHYGWNTDLKLIGREFPARLALLVLYRSAKESFRLDYDADTVLVTASVYTKGQAIIPRRGRHRFPRRRGRGERLGRRRARLRGPRGSHRHRALPRTALRSPGQTAAGQPALLARFGVGHDRVDKSFARRHGIFVTNTRGT